MRILITGISGAIGSSLTRKLESDPNIKDLVGVDIKPPQIDDFTFYRLHVASRKLEDIVKKHDITTIVHLAWMVSQTHNELEEYRTDILGSANILEAARKANVKHIIVASTGKVYGMHESNDHVFSEDDQLNGEGQLAYVQYKVMLENLCEDFSSLNPNIKITVLRPCTILGPNVSNPITRRMKKRRVVSLIEYNPRRQFVDIEDVIEVFYQAIKKRMPGIFNISSDGTVPQHDLHLYLGKKQRILPTKPIEKLLSFLWKLRLSEINPQALDYLKYSIIIGNEKLKKEFGYTPKYSTEETLRRFSNL